MLFLNNELCFCDDWSNQSLAHNTVSVGGGGAFTAAAITE